MKLTKRLALVAALVIPLGLTALPVQAQQRDRGDRGRREAPRQEQAKRARQYPNNPPQVRTGPQSRPAPSRNVPEFRNAPRAAVPRVAPRVVTPAPYIRGRSEGYRSYNYRPSLRGPSVVYRPYAYTFRPRLRIGFGVFLGYPVPYPAYDPYLYAPAYGYPSVSGYGAYGGVSLEISPSNAAVIVDGQYLGIVYDFYDPGRPLSLAIGRHHISVQAPGYRPLDFDVNIVPGQVLPYRGDLAPF
jgi:hypothetical protein